MLGTELAAYGATSAAPLIIFQNTVQVSFQDTGTDFNPFHGHAHVSEDDLNAYKGKKRGSVQGECPHCVCHRHLVTEGALTQFAAEGGRMDLLLEASIILTVSLYRFFIRRGDKCPLREGASKWARHESKAQWESLGEGRKRERCHEEEWWG